MLVQCIQSSVACAVSVASCTGALSEQRSLSLCYNAVLQRCLEALCLPQEEGAFGAAKVVAGAGAGALAAVMAAQVIPCFHMLIDLVPFRSLCGLDCLHSDTRDAPSLLELYNKPDTTNCI